jgi:Zn-dependent protease
MLWIQGILFAFIVIMLVFSLYNSVRSRREKDPQKRGFYAARMNICMGIMLIAIAVTQLFFFTDSLMRRSFGVICFLLGVFNLFAGIRNYGYFQRMNR